MRAMDMQECIILQGGLLDTMAMLIEVFNNDYLDTAKGEYSDKSLVEQVPQYINALSTLQAVMNIINDAASDIDSARWTKGAKKSS